MFYIQSKKEKELLKSINLDIRGVKKSDVFRFLDKNVLPSLETMQHGGYCDFEPLKIYYGIDNDGKEFLKSGAIKTISNISILPFMILV